MLKLLVVDDHLLLAQLLAGLLTQRYPFALQGICTSVAEAQERICADPPDLLLLDVGLPGEDWSDAADAFCMSNPQGAFMIVTGVADTFEKPQRFGPALLAVVQKSNAWFELEAIVSQWLLSTGRLDVQAPERMRRSIEQLSPREQRVFEGLGQGLTNRDIAQMFGLTPSTVDTYRKSICSKLGVSGSELVRQAVIQRCLAPVHAGPQAPG